MAEPINIDIWYREAKEARDHYDSGVAWGCLRQWREALSVLGEQLKKNPALSSDLQQLRLELELVAFPVLPLPDAEKIFQTRLKEFLVSEINIDDALDKRFTFAGYIEKNTERKALLKVFQKNTEQIGGVGIGEWLSRYDKAFNPEERDESAVGKFFQMNQAIASLNKRDQALLQRVLEIYDRWLVGELLDIFDMAVLYRSGDQFSQGDRGRASSMTSNESRRQSIRLPLLQALSKYEQLGNQLITRERIRIKSQQEPVRPSLLYWIKYYRDELGIGHHNSVQRGDLLFRSENGKKLSPEERERVNLVLKSVEENVPLEIDTERSEIIFPTFELPPTAPRASFQTPPLAPKKSESREGGNEAFSFGRGTSFVETPAPQADSGSLSFSSKHVFPAEKPEMKTSPSKPKPNPFHIRPVSLGEDDKR